MGPNAVAAHTNRVVALMSPVNWCAGPNHLQLVQLPCQLLQNAILLLLPRLQTTSAALSHQPSQEACQRGFETHARCTCSSACWRWLHTISKARALCKPFWRLSSSCMVELCCWLVGLLHICVQAASRSLHMGGGDPHYDPLAGQPQAQSQHPVPPPQQGMAGSSGDVPSASPCAAPVPCG